MRLCARTVVSVLFSEPKIPQPPVLRVYRPAARSFSALQRAENSSTYSAHVEQLHIAAVSVLFSEPKIPQLNRARQNG